MNAQLVVRSDGANDALTINAPILANGTNAFVKTGAGSLNLGTAAVNTYTGGTFLNQGTLTVVQDSNFGDATNLNPITLNGGILQGTPATASVVLNVNHPIVVGPAGGTINGNSATNPAFTQVILSGSGPLLITGTGQTVTVIRSNTSNVSTYTGTMTIQSGRIALDVTNLTNPFGTGDIIINGVAGAAGGSLFMQNSGSTWNNRFFLFGVGAESRGAIRMNNNTTLNGPIIMTANATLSEDTTGTATIHGNISGAFTLTLSGTGSSTVNSKIVLTGVNSQAATIANDIVNINSDAALGLPSGTLTLNSSATIAATLQAGAPDIYLNPTRAVNFSTAGVNVIVDTGVNNMTIAGAIGSGNAAGNFTKNGTGTLSLLGTNTYLNSTVISAGALNIQNAAALAVRRRAQRSTPGPPFSFKAASRLRAKPSASMAAASPATAPCGTSPA